MLNVNEVHVQLHKQRARPTHRYRQYRETGQHNGSPLSLSQVFQL